MSNQPTTGSVPAVPLRAGLDPNWTSLGAIVTVALVIALATGFALFLQFAYDSWHDSLAPAIAATWPSPEGSVATMSIQIASQVFQLAFVLWLASLWFADVPRAVNLVPARAGVADILGYAALLFLVKLAASVMTRHLGPSDPRSELGPIVELARSPYAWLVFLAAVVLAALVEEIVFRGILSRTLEASPLGFWLGAGAASAAFALLHTQYGLPGQIIIFAVGMTLAWIRARTGSLWPAILCHAANNAVALVALRAVG